MARMPPTCLTGMARAPTWPTLLRLSWAPWASVLQAATEQPTRRRWLLVSCSSLERAERRQGPARCRPAQTRRGFPRRGWGAGRPPCPCPSRSPQPTPAPGKGADEGPGRTSTVGAAHPSEAGAHKPASLVSEGLGQAPERPDARSGNLRLGPADAPISRAMYIIICETDRQSRSMHETGRSGPGHWDDPEGWDVEGDGRGVQDGGHVYTRG